MPAKATAASKKPSTAKRKAPPKAGAYKEPAALKRLNKSLDAGRIRPPELPVLEIEVVNDLRELSQRRVLQSTSAAHRLERASVTFVGEVRANHVEGSFDRSDRASRGIDKPESRRRIDEPSNQPGRREPVDVGIAACHPDPPLEVGPLRRIEPAALRRWPQQFLEINGRES